MEGGSEKCVGGIVVGFGVETFGGERKGHLAWDLSRCWRGWLVGVAIGSVWRGLRWRGIRHALLLKSPALHTREPDLLDGYATSMPVCARSDLRSWHKRARRAA